jgi:hypothetical protein
MPFHRLPADTLDRSDHPTQKSLNLLDAGLFLVWSVADSRYEVWRKEFTPRGVLYSGILPVVDGERPVEPGEWLLNKLRARDSRYRPAKEAAEEVLSEMRAQEQAEAAADEHRLDALHEELALDYLPLWRKKADPDEFAREYKDWDKAPVHFDMGPRDKREAIRAEAR